MALRLPKVRIAGLPPTVVGSPQRPDCAVAMEFAVLLASVAGLVWLLALWKHGPAIPDWIVPAGVMAVCIAECVFGAPFFSVSVGPVPLTFDRILLGSLVLVGGIQVLRRSLRPQWTRVDLAVLAWAFVLAGSVALTDWSFRDLLPVRRLLFLNLLPVAAWWVARCGVWTPPWQRRWLWMVAGLGLWLAATGVCEWWGWHAFVFPRHILDPEQTEFLGRARGPLLNPVINGMWMNAALAVVLLWVTRGPGRLRWMALPAVLILLAGSYATLTRSVWMGSALTVAVVLLAPLRWRQRLVLVAGGAVAAGLVLGVFREELNRFKRDRDVSVEEMSESVALRPLLAVVAWEMFRDHPAAGVGLGQYSAHKRPYHQVEGYDLPLQKVLPYMQHNVFLSYLTETGIVGLAALTLLLGGCLLTGGRNWSAGTQGGMNPASRDFGLLLVTVTGNYVVNGLFHDVSIIPMSHTLLLVTLAIATAGAPFSPGLAPQTGPAPNWLPPTAGISPGC